MDWVIRKESYCGLLGSHLKELFCYLDLSRSVNALLVNH